MTSDVLALLCGRHQIMCRCSTALENSVKEKISMFCHVEPEQVTPPLLPPQPTVEIETKLTLKLPPWPGHLRARRVVHLPGAAAAGEPGRGGLPEQEAQHAHRDAAQEDADQVEGDVRQASPTSLTLKTLFSPLGFLQVPDCPLLPPAGRTGCWSSAPSPWWGSTPSSPTRTRRSSKRWSTRLCPSATSWRSRYVWCARRRTSLAGTEPNGIFAVGSETASSCWFGFSPCSLGAGHAGFSECLIDRLIGPWFPVCSSTAYTLLPPVSQCPSTFSVSSFTNRFALW